MEIDRAKSMNIVFYLASGVAIVSTVLAITRLSAIHALLYLITSLLSVALIFFTLGAPFIAALETIVYAGAIMVLFIFVVMMLNLGERAIQQESQWLSPGIWIGPTVLSVLLLGELIYTLGVAGGDNQLPAAALVAPKQVGITLFGPYLLGVELASMLLLAGLVGAYYLGHRDVED
jgi:NADH-quinone oxidoreductase subunit J